MALEIIGPIPGTLISRSHPASWRERAFLLERGVAIRQGLRFLRAELPRILATPPDVLSARMVRAISDLAEDWRRRLDERIDHLSGEIAVLARHKCWHPIPKGRFSQPSSLER
jgi:hypothetical protein